MSGDVLCVLWSHLQNNYCYAAVVFSCRNWLDWQFLTLLRLSFDADVHVFV